MIFTKNKWLILLLFIPFFEPAYFTTLSNLHILYKIGRDIVGSLIIADYIFYRRKTFFIFLVVFYNLCLFYSTFLMKGDFSEWFSSACYIISLCMIIEMGARYNPILILQALYYLLGFLTYVNLVLLFAFPNGIFMTNGFNDIGYFFATKNSLGAFLLPEMAIAILYSRLRFNRITFQTILLILTCSFTLIIVQSGTTLVGLAICLIFLLFIYRRPSSNLFNFSLYFPICVLFFILIVLLRAQNAFSFIIVDILHKSLTLTGRTFIWDQAFHMIQKSFLFGYGFRKAGLYISYGGMVYEGHNQILQNMLKGGVIATLLFLALIIICGYRLMKYRKYEVSSIISAFLFAYLMMMLTEEYGNALLFFVLLTLGYHLPDIVSRYSGFHTDRNFEWGKTGLLHYNQISRHHLEV